MLYLKKLNIEDAKEEYTFLQELKSENGFENDYENISYEAFVNEAIPTRLNCSQGIGLKEGRVPDTHFFLWDDNHIVGIFKVRHHLNAFLENGAGHIGYAIAEKYRHRGYASKGLALAIQECKKLMPKEEAEIYMSCRKDNIASLKTMLHNGAYIHHEDDLEYYTRIKK